MQEWFLARLAALKPDLCVTAAYGAMLPQPFIDLPKHGAQPRACMHACMHVWCKARLESLSG